ncbi:MULTISPECIES: HofP DNA utilization family protein [Pantoea]|uniref:HofP DNA utilization family protein n=1 Tax=Pantoea TaxID=53335 RepID=UPI001F26C1E6|nr:MULTISPECIES: HofP DNA utilization family protein [Pantoea]UIL52814.1 DUF2531 family protein [Pantoea agglomerans]
MRHRLLVLLLCCSSALARDPFHPVAGAVCQPPVEPLTGWHLQGIIGRPSRFYAVLVTPQKKAMVVRAGQPLALSPWQLSDIDRRSLTLAVRNSCSAQRTAFYLKGAPHEKDSDVMAGTQLPAAGPRR